MRWRFSWWDYEQGKRVGFWAGWAWGLIWGALLGMLLVITSLKGVCNG